MLGSKNRHIVPIARSILLAFLMFWTLELSAQKPKIVSNDLNLKSIKRQYKEQFRELGKEQKRLKSLLKKFESVADTTAMDQILQSFSKANGLVNESMPTLEKARNITLFLFEKGDLKTRLNCYLVFMSMGDLKNAQSLKSKIEEKALNQVKSALEDDRYEALWILKNLGSDYFHQARSFLENDKSEKIRNYIVHSF